MTDKDKKQLEYELRHIFESGANESRVYEMMVNFIESRELVNKTNDIHNVSDSVCSNCDGYGYTVDENGRRKEHCDKC